MTPVQALSLSFVIKVREYTIPGVDGVYYISLISKSDRLCVSDLTGYLVPANLQGNQLEMIQTSGHFEGYNTVTQTLQRKRTKS